MSKNAPVSEGILSVMLTGSRTDRAREGTDVPAAVGARAALGRRVEGRARHVVPYCSAVAA